MFPPPGYIPVQSAIAGIEVYQPAPQNEKHQPIVDFKCPQCGATTAYSVADGGLTCTFCGYYEAPQSQTVGKRAEQFEFTVETMQRAAQGWGAERNEITCQRCGAATTLPTDALTHTCPFCGSNKVIQRAAPQDDLRPRFLIPFSVQPEGCSKIAREWLGSSWMTPAELQQTARLGEFRPVYIPYWTFDSTCRAQWQAEVGHEKTERYYSNGEWKTHTVIEWRNESGKLTQTFDDLLTPATEKLSQRLLEGIQPYQTEALVPYEAKYLAGMRAKGYDIPLQKAWETARATMRERTRHACIRQASTSRVRNFRMSLNFAEEAWRYILVPLYIAAYDYQSQTYRVMVNGQSGKIAGQRPADWSKVWLVILLALAPGTLLGILGLITLPFAGIGVFIGGLGFFLLIIGLIIGFYLYNRAEALDKA